MRIAVWRYTLPLQTEFDSTVGGGRITSHVLRSLQDLGHEPVVVDKVSLATQQWLESRGIEYAPSTSLKGFSAALILTGPANLMFKGMRETYERIASLKKGARVAYAQWDSALAFQFYPETAKKWSENPVVGWPRDDIKWSLLTQVSQEVVRSSQSKATGYSTAPFKHVRCMFELAEWENPTLPISKSPIEAVGYFGGDRPGRIVELKRWFFNTGIPVKIHGRWSDASKQEIECANVEFMGPVAEGEVRERLNRYALTLHTVDGQYVKQNFIAQRFLECAMARVPTVYSDKIQPTVRHFIEPAGLMVRNPRQLNAMVDFALNERERLVEFNEFAVSEFVTSMAHCEPIRALREVYGK